MNDKLENSENRCLMFQCTEHTLGLASEHWRVLDQAHRKRDLAEYEGKIDVDNPKMRWRDAFHD